MDVSTVAAAGPQSEFRAERGLGYLGGFVGLGAGLSILYATTGVGVLCPLRLATGWDCPLCGGTRLGGALLHLDVGAAFAFNPLVFVGLVVVGALGVLWTVEVLHGPKVRLPRAWSERLSTVPANGWLAISMAAAVVYTLLRNLF